MALLLTLTPGRWRAGDRYLVHLGAGGRALCGRTLGHPEPAGTLPTCRSCLHRAQVSTGVVYLLCFHAPFAHARHYMGWTSDLHSRLFHHERGTGANLLAHVAKAGIGWDLVALWPGDRHLERAMKNHGHARRCPRCKVS